MAREYHKVIPCVYLVFQRNNKILLLQRANTGYMDGWYSLPSGHIDGGEPAITAAVREAQEEVGLKLDPAHLNLVHMMHRQVKADDRFGHERIGMFFEVTSWHGEPIMTASSPLSAAKRRPATIASRSLVELKALQPKTKNIPDMVDWALGPKDGLAASDFTLL